MQPLTAATREVLEIAHGAIPLVLGPDGSTVTYQNVVRWLQLEKFELYSHGCESASMQLGVNISYRWMGGQFTKTDISIIIIMHSYINSCSRICDGTMDIR